jgi:peptide/nickel transport system ATP-binding protein
MILITHDMGVVAETCDRVAIMYAGEFIEIGSVEDIFEGKHHHPYTRGLFGSIPDLEGTASRLTPIDGLMPDPSNLPSGCAFHPRCPECMEICKDQKPPFVSFGTHTIRCFMFKPGGDLGE